MKIKELKILLKDSLSKIEYRYEETQKVSQQGTQSISLFSNLDEYRKGVNNLELSGLFIKEIDIIRKSPIFTTGKDFANINLAEGRKLKSNLEEFYRIVQSVAESIQQIGGESHEDSISIKLPEVKDFEDLSKYSSDFHKILTQAILNEQINGDVRIDNVENGSIWLDVYLGSAAAVSLIGSLAWASAVVYKKIQEGRIIEQHVIGLNIKNDSLKEIQVGQKKAIDLLIEAEATNLFNENFETPDSEQIERLKHCIKMLSNLIDKGAEIHPALNQPESVKNLFPKMNELPLLESKIKKLEN